MPTDPRGLRGGAPPLDAWLRFQETPPTPFTIPGHKQRDDLVGDVVAGDVPLYARLDTMRLDAGVLLQAGEAVTVQVLAALDEARRAGIRIAYAADASLQTLRVVRNLAATCGPARMK